MHIFKLKTLHRGTAPGKGKFLVTRELRKSMNALPAKFRIQRISNVVIYFKRL